MIMVPVKDILLLLFASFMLVSCVGEAPYIYKDDEFDRNDPYFAKELKDRSMVEICYNKQTTTPQVLIQMATDECRRFGKKALFLRHRILKCSVASPAMAEFSCSAAK